MGLLKDLDQKSLISLEAELNEKLKKYKGMGLNLNMARGKPCKEQVDLSNALIDGSINFNINGDYRNYGILDGIVEAKEIYKDLLKVTKEELIIGGNSSLNLMYDAISKAMLLGCVDSDRPWVKEDNVKFLCPVPGYDRHFAITEAFGFEMINIDMDVNGPIMDQVEALVANDPSIKGIWCVPKYSNPSGITYSDEVVTRLATMKTAAKDFRIMWDDAYTVHHLTDVPDQLKDILAACKEAGNANRVYIFSSTSKITFPGGGISMMACSKENADFIRQQMGIQTIGSDKLNQLMHAKFLPSVDAITEHMKKHAAIIGPKFEMVNSILEKELGGKGIASWVKPNGGYFISLDVPTGCAKKVVQMCKDLGVILTDAGATFPYKKDPMDNNIRIAPTFPPLNELELAIEVLCVCVLLCAIDQAK